MKNKHFTIKRVLFCLMLVLLFVPLIQAKFHVVKVKPLKGAVTEPVNTSFTFKGWFSGAYQQQEEKYLNETFGFRNLFIRINNQMAFTLFRKAKANGVIVGKDNFLFEESYIKAYYGSDYIGRDSITHRMQRVKFIQDTLSKMDKDIILVFAAGKGSYYPEYFPERFKTEKGVTNYETHVELARQLGIPYIDFNRYFLQCKNTTEYPLYPQYGIHWSTYGMGLVADSIIRFIENARNIDMPDLYWDTIKMAQPNESDYDIADGMNLLFRLKSFDMAYPNITFQDDADKTKPSVLVISDSYYWGMYNFGISNAFSNSHFWFYNRQIYPESFQSPLETSQVDLMKQIQDHDVIIIMATEATLPDFGWGFVENTYRLFKYAENTDLFDPAFQARLDGLRNYIKSDERWMRQIENKAESKQITVDSMITLDAIWTLRHEAQSETDGE